MRNEVKQAVILAGGRGERLKPFTDKHPKPLYMIQNRPFIEYLIDQIASFGIKDIVILLGYKYEQIESVLNDGARYDVNIRYDVTPVEFDTGDRILHAYDMLEDRFLLMYCDNYCPINFQRLIEDSFLNDALIQLSVYSNKDQYTKNNIKIRENSELVEIYDKCRVCDGLQGVDIGYAVVKKEVIERLKCPVGNFASAVYSEIVMENRMYATVTDHRYYSIGSYERMSLTEDFFKKKSVVFLDRDGTINVRPPKACYIEKPDDFKWLPGAIEALRLLKENDVITILVSNQPGIARGNLTKNDLNRIHEKMQHDLKENHAEIDYIYYCPHNWDEGCDCRKPKPGMLYQAQKDLSLNLSECILFGDDERDMQAAESAGCKHVLISENYPLLEAVKNFLSKGDSI